MKYDKPWGYYEILSDSNDHKVKRITVYPNERLSYQKHLKRFEHWFIIKGKALVIKNNEEINLQSGGTIDIQINDWHRIKNIGDENLIFIEIQTGSYFGEDDIERSEDDYGRAQKSDN
ncbi:MAG: phosphomannose isomerase type II C-terminal cupin domain [Spirochaetia bacterium]|nr:phosphomannose isomerase type II C-terminal cupin domain [Spirochaetia bacterium]